MSLFNESGRWRSIAKTATGVTLFRVVAMACGFLQLPLAVNALGAERFGLWTVIASAVALLNFSDLGIGNGLQTKLGIYFGQNKNKKCIDITCSSIALLSLLAVVVLFISFVLKQIIDFTEMLGFSSSIHGIEADQAINSALICLALSLPLSAMSRVGFALKKGGFVSIIQALASLISLILCYAISRGNPTVAHFIYVQSIPNLILTALAGGWALISAGLKPKVESFFCFSEARETVTIGLSYLVPQIGFVFVTSVQNILIGRYLGLSDAGLYGTLTRLFTAFTLPHVIMISSIAPEYSHAYGAQDLAWLKRNYIRSIYFTGIWTVVVLMISVISIRLGLIQLLGAGHFETPPLPLVAALAIWTGISMFGASVACLLNSIGRPHRQAICGTIYVMVATILMAILIPWCGLYAVPLTLSISYLCIVVPFVFPEATTVLGKTIVA